MKCEDARARFLEGTAGASEMEHMNACAQCRAERRSLEDARAALDDPRFWETPPPGLEDRLVAMIAATPAVRPDVSSRPWMRRMVIGGAAAALLATALWVGMRGPTPDWRVDLPGTENAPLASGVVSGWNEAGGTRLALEIDGLPPAPLGFLYEFWLTEGEIHVSAGTFTSPDDVELWAGVARADFPRLWITLEPIDEDESPSGINVMDTR